MRLATYEDAEEAKLLRKIYTGRSGGLENTVFAILSPDGERELVRSGRSPHFSFRSASDMASAMKRISQQYAAKDSDHDKALPTMATVRLALNVAACDRQPLIVVQGENETQRKALEDRLATIAWSDEFIGQFA